MPGTETAGVANTRVRGGGFPTWVFLFSSSFTSIDRSDKMIMLKASSKNEAETGGMLRNIRVSALSKV